MLLDVLKIAAAVAVGLPILLYFYQERMLFYPTPPVSSVPRPARGEVEEVRLVAADGIALSGWFVSNGVRRGEGRSPLVIYFGGNAEDVSWLVGMADRFAGHSLLVLNYRGYGGSGGRPGESALFADALLAYEYARQRGDLDATRFVAMGRSLGSGVAVYLASHRQLAGVILVTPYDSVRALAQSIYPWLPVGFLLKHPFDSLSRADKLTTPLLCLVAENDRVIPRVHSLRLFDAWRGGDKRWVELRAADHDDISGEPRYWDEIAAFLGRFALRER